MIGHPKREQGTIDEASERVQGRIYRASKRAQGTIIGHPKYQKGHRAQFRGDRTQDTIYRAPERVQVIIQRAFLAARVENLHQIVVVVIIVAFPALHGCNFRCPASEL